MKVEIKKEKVSSILYEGKFYDTGKELDLSFSDTFRLTRVANLKTEYDSVPYNPELWKEKKFINFFGDIDLSSGFGNCSYYLVKESFPKLEVALAGKSFNVREQLIYSAQKRDLRQDGAMVWHDQPREQWLYSPFKKNIAIIPWETTTLPASWIGKINQFDAVFVPCRQNIVDFRNSGVKIPIELIHWGIDPNKFHPIERVPNRPFTFGTLGALSIRKGTDVLISAFREAFPTEKDVKLICKTSFNNYPFAVKDSRIEVQMMQVSNKELMDNFYKRVDCFAFPTRGEGFGLTPLEAMATGIPAIVTGWSGPLEYMTPEVGWLIDHTMVPAIDFTKHVYKENCGDWAEPSKEHLKQLMRYAYEHQDEVRAKGAQAAEYVNQNWLWRDRIKEYHTALEKHL
jgi:glycosyltransferase involved in cell wall biosynthesis